LQAGGEWYNKDKPAGNYSSRACRRPAAAGEDPLVRLTPGSKAGGQTRRTVRPGRLFSSDEGAENFSGGQFSPRKRREQIVPAEQDTVRLTRLARYSG
jgi:hypothetical protein